MRTTLQFFPNDAADMSQLPDQSVELIVTSPPYPMIAMWDECFIQQDEQLTQACIEDEPYLAFERMHSVLDRVWKSCDRVLKTGGFLCINVGDATRSSHGVFQMFPNHARIIHFFAQKGYCILPDIHWRKPSNAPNKFMGSGMFPAGAYVTYEHEYILIFRKGGKRTFSSAQRKNRQKIAYFWEERNLWFSDLW